MLKSIALLAPLGLAASFAAAQPTMASYDVTHHFAYTPPPGTNPTLFGALFEHAWVWETGGYQDAAVLPLNQNAGFDMFGVDTALANGGAANHPRSGAPPVPCVFMLFAIPPAGFTNTHCTMVVSPNTGTNASACTAFDIQPYGPGQTMRGTIRSAGVANAFGRGINRAYAFSAASVGVGNIGPFGQITWTALIDSVSGWAGAVSRQRDPVILTVRDATGNEASAVLLDIEFSTQGSDRFRWNNNQIDTDARDAIFIINMDPRAAVNHGRAILRIQNGVVVESAATGPFAGLLPPIGAATPLSFPFPNDIRIDFDGSGLLPTRIVDSRLYLGGGGEAPSTTRCPADFNGDGVVDFFDYLDFVMAYDEGGPDADFNGDGQVDFFDYLDFVEAFNQGCEE